MTRGAPTPSEILIKVGIRPINSAKAPEDQVAEGNVPAARTHGPYLRYSVNYAIEPGDLSFIRTSDGKVHGDFELMIVAFDSTGLVVNSTDNTVHMAGSLDEIKEVASRAIFYHAEISTPVKGQYFLRIAVRDLHRDHFGAVEVATSEVRDLLPSDAALPTPAAQTNK
ncbi:MAG TPA: hypothetical protein VF865_19910 [Acidobacteriaceae bacterium]